MIQRSLTLRPQRFWVAVLSVSMGAAVAVAFADLSLVFGDRLAESLRAYGANLILVPEGSSLEARLEGTDYRPAIRTAAIAESSLVRIHKSYWRNNILGYAPRLAAIGRLDGGKAITVVGTWFSRRETTPEGHTFTAGMTTVAPWWEVEGRLPDEDAEECLIGRALLDRLGLSVGQEIAISLDAGTVRYRIVGVLAAGVAEEGTIYVPLTSLQQSVNRPGEVDRVLVSALIKPGFPPAPDATRNPEAFEQWACTPYVTSVAYDLDRSVPGVEARPVTQLVEAEGRVVHRVNLLMLLLAFAAITGAGLGVMSTMMASVVERTREFALQRALGASRNSLLVQLALEGLLVGLLGGVLGSAIGAALARIAGRAAFDFAIPFHPLVWLLGVLVALAVAGLGLWVPLRMATAVEPAQGLHE